VTLKFYIKDMFQTFNVIINILMVMISTIYIVEFFDLHSFIEFVHFFRLQLFRCKKDRFSTITILKKNKKTNVQVDFKISSEKVKGEYRSNQATPF